VGRLSVAIGRALVRAILGKSSHEHMKQFTGDDEWWATAIAAGREWHRQQAPTPVAEAAGNSPASEYEPVHGWTRRQLEWFLTRNPGYRPTYNAALRGCSGAATEMNGHRVRGV
jgi:hypothetical protein